MFENWTLLYNVRANLLRSLVWQKYFYQTGEWQAELELRVYVKEVDLRKWSLQKVRTTQLTYHKDSDAVPAFIIVSLAGRRISAMYFLTLYFEDLLVNSLSLSPL